MPYPEFAIDVHGLSKSFSGRKVVDDFAIRVQRGHIFGFLGPNGSGKTTTIRLICGLLTPDSGEPTTIGTQIDMTAENPAAVTVDATFPANVAVRIHAWTR